MAATGIGNPAGFQCVADGENPRMITGYARAQTISGGVFCFGSTATGVVSSGADTYASSDILFAPDASGVQFNGIAFQTAGSNQPIAVAMRGVMILTCNGSVTGGMPVTVDGNNSVASTPWLSTAGSPLTFTRDGLEIGRALTDGASGGYAIIHING